MNAHSHTDFAKPAAKSRKLAPWLPINRRYILEIIESEAITLGGVTELAFTAQVVAGDYAGREVNFKQEISARMEYNDDGIETVVDDNNAGDQEFAALCQVTGAHDPMSLDELHHKPFAANVTTWHGREYLTEFSEVEPANAPAPKPAKTTPPRDAQGRFLKADRAEPEAEVEQTEERRPWEEVSAWTPEQRFMFDLEGHLYELTALAATLETLLTPLTNKMAGYDRPTAASLDYAVTHLANAVEKIEERYMAVRFPDQQADAA